MAHKSGEVSEDTQQDVQIEIKAMPKIRIAQKLFESEASATSVPNYPNSEHFQETQSVKLEVEEVCEEAMSSLPEERKILEVFIEGREKPPTDDGDSDESSSTKIWEPSIQIEEPIDENDVLHEINAAKNYFMNNIHNLLNLKKNETQPVRKYKETTNEKTGTDTDEKSYKCKMCDKTFSQRGELKGHIRTHTGEKPYECTLCSKTFAWKSDSRRHIRTHTGQKSYACKICNKTFFQQGDMKKHFRTHTGERPFSCSICNKTFSQRGDLTRHTRTHTGEKPYNCEMCSKTFSRQSHLQRHTRTHTGEKPYTCKMCNKTFSHQHHLQRHVKNLSAHTGEMLYVCSVCCRSFRNKISLRKHIETHNG